MLLEISGEITPERMKGWSQRKKKNPVVDVTGDKSKVQCCKEQYCIGIWNARAMNQGKLEVVKQEMARVSIDIPVHFSLLISKISMFTLAIPL